VARNDDHLLEWSANRVDNTRPDVVITQAASAAQNAPAAIQPESPTSSAASKRNVDAEYMPMGKTRDQYCGSYRIGTRRTPRSTLAVADPAPEVVDAAGDHEDGGGEKDGGHCTGHRGPALGTQGRGSGIGRSIAASRSEGAAPRWRGKTSRLAET
jgi:hypothetical protein